jgi:hypothetical protein
MPLVPTPGPQGGAAAVLAGLSSPAILAAARQPVIPEPSFADVMAGMEARLDSKLSDMQQQHSANLAASDARADARAAAVAADHDREMADIRAELAAEREWNRERDSNLGSTLQNFLLDVDTLLPAGADAKTIKKARAFHMDNFVVQQLQEHGIVPECGFDFHAENSINLLLAPAELQKSIARLPRPDNVLEPGRVDERIYAAFSGRTKSSFDHARKTQFELNDQYEKYLLLAHIAVDDELDVDEKLDGILKAIAQLTKHLLHDYAVAERERLNCTGKVYNDDPDFKLPELNFDGERPLVTSAVVELFDAAHRYRDSIVAT